MGDTDAANLSPMWRRDENIFRFGRRPSAAAPANLRC